MKLPVRLYATQKQKAYIYELEYLEAHKALKYSYLRFHEARSDILGSKFESGRERENSIGINIDFPLYIGKEKSVASLPISN